MDQEEIRKILENIKNTEVQIVPLDGVSVDVQNIDTTFRFPKAADEFNRREYVVTLYNYEDLDSFYEDIETEGGNLYIPDRAVPVELRRPISRNTNYRLTEEEANTIKNDPRVQDVELTLEERGHSIVPTWTQTSTQWSKSSTIRSGDNNWGLLRCTIGQQQPLWGLYTLDSLAKDPSTNKGTLANISLLPDISYLAIIDTSGTSNNRNFIFSGNVRTWGFTSWFYAGQIAIYNGILYICTATSFTWPFNPFPSSSFIEPINGNYIHSYYLYSSTADGRTARSSLVRKLYYRSGSTVATIARFLNVVTITTNTAHGFVTGNSISVVLTTNTSISGTYTITGASTTTFTYTTTASGTLSSRVDIGVVSLLTEKINLKDQYTINNEVYEWDGLNWRNDVQTGTVTTSSSGKNVDLIICDSPINPAHPEYAKNPNGSGGSRVVQYNWFKDNLSVTGKANGTYTYTDFTQDHGAHVAGIAGGNTQGWARDANIYSLYYSATGVNSDNVLDYIKWFHQTKPINTATGRQNPTVVNCSWGVSPTRLYFNLLTLGTAPPLDIYWIRTKGYLYYTRYFDLYSIAGLSGDMYWIPTFFTAQSSEIKDNSGKAIPATLSNNGGTPVTPDNLIIPYKNTYSYKFNGGYLTSIDQTIISFQKDFTIEFWIYPVSTSSLRPIITCNLFGIYLFSGKITFGIVDTSTGTIQTKITSTTTILPTTWYHVVFTRYKNTSVTPNVSTVYLFINGTVEGSVIDSTVFNSIRDTGLGNSGAPYPFSPSIEAVSSTAGIIPFANTNSYFFANKNQFLKIENTTAFSFGSGSFTFEVWVYLDGRGVSIQGGENYYTLFSPLGYKNGISCVMCADCISIGDPGYAELGYFVPAGSTLGTVYFQQSTWYHIAITKSSGTCRGFVNGVPATYSDGQFDSLRTFAIPTTAATYYIGAEAPGSPFKDTDIPSRAAFTGYMSNLRVVKGQALYTAAFTPSTVPLTTSSQSATPANVALLTCQSPPTTIVIGNISLRAYISNLRIAQFSVYRGENFTYPNGDLEGPLGGAFGGVKPLVSGVKVSDTQTAYFFYFPTRSTSLEADITDMINRGVVVSWASGNEYSYIALSSDDLTSEYNDYFYIYNQLGPLTGSGPAVWEIYYPFRGNSGAVPGCICVGNASEYIDERKSESSNFGPRIDIYAPGSNIMSSVNLASTASADTRNASYYHRRLTGTSMASPQVCGVLACLAETYPQLTEATALLYLKEKGTKNQMADFGAGYGSYSTTLRGAPNLYLYYSPEAPSIGLLYPKSNVAKTLTGQTQNVGLLYPRPRIRLR